MGENNLTLKERKEGKILFSNHMTVSEFMEIIIENYGLLNVLAAVNELEKKH